MCPRRFLRPPRLRAEQNQAIKPAAVKKTKTLTVGQYCLKNRHNIGNLGNPAAVFFPYDLDYRNWNLSPSGVNSPIQNLCRPLIDALAIGFGSGCNCGMDLGRNTQHKLAGIWLVRFLAQLLTRCQIIIYGFAKSGFELGHGFSVKAHDITNANNVSD